MKDVLAESLANLELARCYLSGAGTDIDPKTAIKKFELACICVINANLFNYVYYYAIKSLKKLFTENRKHNIRFSSKISRRYLLV